MRTKTLKHTWKKDLPFPVEVKIHVDVEKKEYWMELNGCQETNKMNIPNIEETETPQCVECGEIEKRVLTQSRGKGIWSCWDCDNKAMQEEESRACACSFNGSCFE